MFERERSRIFARSWICAGREEHISDPGAFVLVNVAGESLILTRDRAGAIHAFYNVCRHRGTRLCTSERGRFKGAIQCPYHAWTYALDGSLTIARNMEENEGFDRAGYPLREAATARFEGFIFVAVEPKEPFEVAFAPVLGRFSRWNLATLRSRARKTYELACNWKLVFQNYSECYHCPTVHPQLERLSPSRSGRNDLTDGPFLGGFSELRETSESLTTSGHTSRKHLGGLEADDASRVYYYTVFPSLLLSLHPDYVMAHYVEPLSPAATRITCEWFFAPEEREIDDAVEFWDLTNSQDWKVNELTQQGVASRAYTPGPYAQAEGLLHAFDRHYLETIA